MVGVRFVGSRFLGLRFFAPRFFSLTTSLYVPVRTILNGYLQGIISLRGKK